MPYVINKTNGQPLLTLDDGVLDTSTSLSLMGRNFVGYGELQNENFVHLLENFSGINPPSRPITGQVWFNSQNNVLHVYDGSKWIVIGSAPLSETPPVDPSIGSLWFKIPVGTLHVYNGSEWILVGPEAAEGFGPTAAKSTVILDIFGNPQPVILFNVDGTVLAIASSRTFSIGLDNEIPGFSELAPGINLSTNVVITGTLQGKSSSADKLETIRNINGIGFNGESDITIKASTQNKLTRGSYLTGSDFDGSENSVWSVDATPDNTIGKVVARDSSGSFSAGTVTANLFVGNVNGNVIAESGTSNFNIVTANQFIGANLTGNARTATRLATSRTINGVSFDGTENITVTADASTLTGNVLNSSVTASNLTQLGTLTNLNVDDNGIFVGAGGQLRISSSGSTTSIKNNSNNGTLEISITDSSVLNNTAKLSFISSSQSLLQSGDNLPALIPSSEINLGHPSYNFEKIYASTVIANLQGNSNTATLASSSSNLEGGVAGSIPYQASSSDTSFLAPGVAGQVLRSGGPGSPPTWGSVSFSTLQRGNYLTGSNYDGFISTIWSVDASTGNIGDKIVARDSSGNFSAGTITASLNGNASTATRLQTGRTINGIYFDGTANINIPLTSGTDPSKVSKSGDSMTGYLTLVGAPVSSNHAATKSYVDSRAINYQFTYGKENYPTSGYSSIVGSWNFNTNYFDVYPPSGKSMSNLIAFIPSISVIHFAGDVNGDDSLLCTYSILSNRIRVYVQNTEQRSAPAANWLAIWS